MQARANAFLPFISRRLCHSTASQDLFALTKTTLPNSICIITSSSHYSIATTLRITVDAGPNREHHENQGVSHYWRRFLYKSTQSVSGLQMTRLIETLTQNLSVRTTHNSHEIQATFLHESARDVTSVLGDLLVPRIPEWEFRDVRELVRHDVEVRKANRIQNLLDTIQRTAFRSYGAGYTTTCPEHNINNIYPEHLAEFVYTQVQAQNISMVAETMDHGYLADSTAPTFMKIPKTDISPSPLKPEYFGGILTEATGTGTIFALAYPAADSSPQGDFSLRILCQLIGSYSSRFCFPGDGVYNSKLARHLFGTKNVDYASSFVIKNDLPLFGVYAVGSGTCSKMASDVASVLDFIQNITEEEFEDAFRIVMSRSACSGLKRNPLMDAIHQLHIYGSGSFGRVTFKGFLEMLNTMCKQKPTVYANGDLQGMPMLSL